MNNGDYLSRPAVLLDMDNTILDFDMAERVAIGRTFDALGVKYDENTIKRYNVINIQHWEMLEKGILTRAEVLVNRFRALFEEIGSDCDPFITQQIYEKLLSEGHWFMPGAEKMLEELSGRYRLFICSNGSASVQAGRIKSAGISPYFERIFVSENMGCNKPSREYYELCFKEIPEFDRARAIMVGDSLTSDILGGVNAGIKTCWYNPKGKTNPGKIFPDYEINDLAQLGALLDSLFDERTCSKKTRE